MCCPPAPPLVFQPRANISVTPLSPQAVLRIHFIEAQDLLGKDKFLRGLIKGKSDPYGVIKVGTELFQSKVIHETVNPKWNEVYEVGGVFFFFTLLILTYFFKTTLISDTKT